MVWTVSGSGEKKVVITLGLKTRKTKSNVFAAALTK